MAWCLLVAVGGCWHLSHELPRPLHLMGTRYQGIAASLATMERGGPPLLGSRKPYGSPGIEASRDYFPVGIADDQGVYIYLPVLGLVTGDHDPESLLRWFFLGSFGLLLLAYPLIFYGLFGSILAAAVAPLLVVATWDYLIDTDIYWINGWVVLLGLPLVMLAWRRSGRKSVIALLVSACALASFASSIRVQSGLPVEIAAALVLVVQPWPRRTRALVAVVLALVSMSISTTAVDGIRLARDKAVGVAFRDRFPDHHPFWHNAYIGLGYLPNPYGIAWNDDIAVAAVKRVNPDALNSDAEYQGTLRHLYFKLLRNDPTFVLDTLWTKLGAVLSRGLAYGWPALLLAAYLLLFSGRRRQLGFGALLIAPALAIDLLPPVLTLPSRLYETGWLAAIQLAGIMSATYVVATLSRGGGGALRAAPVATIRGRLDLGLPEPRALATAGLAAAAVSAVAAAAIVHSHHYVFDSDLRQPTTVAPLTPPRRDWDFRTAVPHGWSTLAGARTTAAGGRLTVHTSTGANDYELWSPRMSLPAGVYRATMTGRVSVGGLQLGVLDIEANAWIASTYYRPRGVAPLATHFTLSRQTDVEVVLANAVDTARASIWSLRAVSVIPQESSHG